MPLPVRASSNVEFAASLAKVTLLDAVPLLWGVNVTVNGALWPVARVKGNESPLKVNSEVPTMAEETATLEPVALSVAVILSVVPATTLPKFKVPGLTLS